MTNKLEYAGFWIRVWASIIDNFLLVIITMPILFAIYGVDYYLDSDDWIAGSMDFLLSYILPAFAVILFWIYRQATPGKMVIHAKIVDAETGEKPTIGQCVGRYFAYIPSMLVFGIGIFWVAFDKKKQGWHDKLAGTVVVKNKNTGADDVKFKTYQIIPPNPQIDSLPNKPSLTKLNQIIPPNPQIDSPESARRFHFSRYLNPDYGHL